jgi:hypothetical protein
MSEETMNDSHIEAKMEEGNCTSCGTSGEILSLAFGDRSQLVVRLCQECRIDLQDSLTHQANLDVTKAQEELEETHCLHHGKILCGTSYNCKAATLQNFLSGTHIPNRCPGCHMKAQEISR